MRETITKDLTREELLAKMPHGIGRLEEKLGIEVDFVGITAERATGTMPVDGNTQSYGLLHGGASAAFAEALGTAAAAWYAASLDKLPVGIDINATHHRAALSGLVHGVATAAHLGKTAVAYDIILTNDEGKRICTARLSCTLINARRFL